MKGIIYRYTSPSGKVYIGQTTDEKTRRATFFNLDYHYGGEYINAARKKYGPKEFKYEVLENIDLPEKELKQKLDELEIFYIEKYSSNNREFGYNLTLGGGTTLGYKFTEEAKANLSKIRKGRVFCKRTKEIQDKITASNSKEIQVLDMETGIIEIFKSAIELSLKWSIPASSIRNCIYRKNLYKKRYKITYTNWK